jgi:hypothetical protein
MVMEEMDEEILYLMTKQTYRHKLYISWHNAVVLCQWLKIQLLYVHVGQFQAIICPWLSYTLPFSFTNNASRRIHLVTGKRRNYHM